MAASQVLNILGATLGFIGALLLYKGSFALIPMSNWESMDTIEAKTKANRRLQILQRSGLSFVMASFATQIIAQFV